MRKLKFLIGINLILLILAFLLILPGCGEAKKGISKEVENDFISPPISARPRVWWHWMNGNITKEGISADLQWMHRTGIAGFQNFDAGLATPQVVEKRLIFMTPEWKDAFRHTTVLADSLGLEMAIAGSPGWSESGGPWVKPEEGMKKLVWSEIIINGGTPFTGTLPHPPANSGVFQNLGAEGGFGQRGEGVGLPEYYSDIAVIAYRIPEPDVSLMELKPTVTSSGGKFTLEMLTDGDLSVSSLLPINRADSVAWIKFEFSQPQTIYSLTMVGGGSPGRFGIGRSRQRRSLEASDDGKIFRKVTDIPGGGVPQNTITFSPVTAKYFRITITNPPSDDELARIGQMFGMRLGGEQQPQGTQIAEIVLHTVPKIHRFEEKAGFAVVTNVEDIITPELLPEGAVKPEDIINITDKLRSDGTLDWTPPEGRWKIMRFGYSLTGRQNHPASPEATGLEVDKLNPDHVRSYFTQYLDMYKDATGGLMGDRGLKYIITDSWEAGVANWTDKMVEEFNRRNSYDILPWLPVLAGNIVESAAKSEKFLWDFRNTLEEMLAEYHYDNLTQILKERRMGRYTESHESGRAFIGDGMEVKRSADIPMSATWTPGGLGGSETAGVAVRHETDIRESASVAHIYGQNIVAAESFTTGRNAWAFDPERLKPTADFMLAAGLNRFVIHTSVHQPVNDKIPGLGLGPFGQWFTRHETWAEMARPWIDYLARSSYLLQQGRFVADIIYAYGQGHNLTALFGNRLPEIPEGYNYDFLNAGAIPAVLSVKGNKIVTPSGMEYKLLVLDESTKYMTLPVLKKIKDLVSAGAVVAGPKPVDTPSLNDDGTEFKSIADELWPEGKGSKKTGKGAVYSEYTVDEVLKELGITPDFVYTADSKMKFVHRTAGNDHIYWVSTTSKVSSVNKVSFRLTGLKPEIWNPVSGEITNAPYSIKDGRTEVTLRMTPDDALFIVFREKADKDSFEMPAPSETPLLTVEGEWNVKFQPGRGAPEEALFPSLTPWNENQDPGIKYFSCTAEYVKTVTIEEGMIDDNSELWLDLGDVENLAEVTLNDHPLGIVWKKPFRVKISGAVKPGENTLKIKVANLWVNRLIGDQQPGVEKPITYTTQAFYRADAPLFPSGLLGPVVIYRISTK
ncbi:MAG: glycosyl hydrolase [Bacteroidales bacterium]